MASSRLVIAGNSYLAARARAAGAPVVALIPTVVDLARYPLTSRATPVGIPRIVWIGSPSTVRYLTALTPALRALAATHRFRLRVIGAKIDMDGVDVECLDWSEDSEVRAVGECAIGIMPLADTPWELGKCGYKLVQYMACGLPVVASPVGANLDIVDAGINGLLATTPAQWTSALAGLLDDAPRRVRMGVAGRTRVERDFSVEAHVGHLAAQLRAAGRS